MEGAHWIIEKNEAVKPLEGVDYISGGQRPVKFQRPVKKFVYTPYNPFGRQAGFYPGPRP